MVNSAWGRWALGLLLVGATLAEERSSLLVVQTEEGSVAFLHPESGTNQATVRVGAGPHEVAVSSDGRRAVVTNYGLDHPGTSISVIDVEGQRLLRTIHLTLRVPQRGGEAIERTFHRPHGVCFGSSASQVLVTCEAEGVLLLVDVDEGRVIDAIDVGQELPHLVLLDRSGRRAFVSNQRSGSVAVVDLSRRRVTDVIETGGGAQGMALHPVANELWVANLETNSISVLDTETLKETAEFACGAYPVRLAFTQDGGRVLCVNYQTGSISVFDGGTRRLVREVRLEKLSAEQEAARPLPENRKGFGRTVLPVGLQLSPDGRTAWVACSRSDRVAEFDVAGLEVRAYHDVPGCRPDGLAWSSFQDDVTSAK